MLDMDAAIWRWSPNRIHAGRLSTLIDNQLRYNDHVSLWSNLHCIMYARDTSAEDKFPKAEDQPGHIVSATPAKIGLRESLSPVVSWDQPTNRYLAD